MSRSMEEELRQFELEEWGTNDLGEIVRKIHERKWEKSQARMTGMAEEQADWEGFGCPACDPDDGNCPPNCDCPCHKDEL